jgi:branched-chain amino acid transport system substrate-binding protein
MGVVEGDIKTFLIADVRGYTRFTQQRGDDAGADLARRFAAIVAELAPQHAGVLQELRGDEALVVFDSARQALRFALSLQDTIAEQGLPRPVGVGLDAGEAVPVEGGFRGGALNRAARLCALAKPGEVLVSEAVCELAGATDGVVYGLRRQERLKGFERPVGIVEIYPAERAPGRDLRRRATRALLGTRPRVRLAAAFAVAAALAAWVTVSTTGGGGKPRGLTTVGNSLAAIDPGTGRIDGDFPVGNTPTSVSVGHGAVWVLNADDKTVSRVDPANGSVNTFGVGSTPIDLAVGGAGVWVGNGVRPGSSVTPVLTGLSQLDPGNSGSLLQTVDLPDSEPVLPELAVGNRAVWTIGPDNGVYRIDPERRKVVAKVKSLVAMDIAVGPDGALWALSPDGHVLRVDKRSNRITFAIKPAASGLSDLAVGAGAVWASDPYDGTIWRIDPGPKPVTRTISVPSGTDQLAFGSRGLWAVDSLGGTVAQIDPRLNRIERTITVGNTPRGIAVGAGHVWVTVEGAANNSLPAAFRSTGAASIALPSSACGNVVYGGAGEPQDVIATDFPLHVGPRAPVLAMSQAVEFVLRQRHFMAGRYRIAFQSCDDSTAQSGNFDPLKCTANAKLAAADPHVLGVIGPFNSDCAAKEIPIAGRASLALVSPATSISSLTRAPPGSSSADLATLYPGGRRTFFRVYPADDSEATALAMLTKQLHAKRVFVLRGGDEEYVDDIAPWFAPAAQRLGITVAGMIKWEPDAKNDLGIAQAVKRSRADAVYLAGLPFDGRVAGEIIRHLRKEFGPRLPLIADDGFLPVSQLFQAAGPAARGIYLGTIGLTPNLLPAAGRRFLKQFAATQPGGVLDPSTGYWVAYAAAATQSLLDAIARSDGTRPAIVRALSTARLDATTVGEMAFDRNGDTTNRPIAIYRAQNPGGSIQFEAVQGASYVRTIRVPQHLLR